MSEGPENSEKQVLSNNYLPITNDLNFPLTDPMFQTGSN
jgi:hypothetical protein